MGFFSRLATFFRIRANAALDKAEDPGQVMDYSYGKQLEQLQNLKRSIADVVTNEKRLEMQQSQIQQQSDKLGQQAMLALQANREDLARGALGRTLLPFDRSIDVHVSGTDNVAVATIKIYGDGKFVDQVTCGGASCSGVVWWLTGSLASGTHTITAVAADTSGNQTTTPPVTINK